MDYIKRCVAQSGQTLEVRDKEVYTDNNMFPHSPGLTFKETGIIPRNVGRYTFNTFSDQYYGSRDNFGPLLLPAPGDTFHFTGRGSPPPKMDFLPCETCHLAQ